MRNESLQLLVDQGVEHFFDLQEDPTSTMTLMAGDLSEEEQAQLDALGRKPTRYNGSEG